MSTSLIMPGDDFTQSDPEEIRDLLDKQVDLVIHGGYIGQKPTTVIDFTDDTPVVARVGTGDPTLLSRYKYIELKFSTELIKIVLNVQYTDK